jgi:hypothetical protein
MRWRSTAPAIGGASLVLAIAAAICLAAQPGSAQDTPKVVVDIGDCVGLKSRDERLACFDRHVETATPNPEASPAPQTSAAEPPPTTPAAAVAPAPTPASLPAAQAAAAPATAAASVAVAAGAAATTTVPSPAQPVATAAPTPPAPSSEAAPSPSTSAENAPAPKADHKAPQSDAQTKPPEIVAIVTELHETVPNAWLITLDNGQVWRQSPPQRFALKTGQRVTLRTSKWGVAYRLSADTLNGFIQVERVR